MRILRIGSGAGYSGDRIEPAVDLAERGELDYLVFECLAERTIALAQQDRRVDAQAGYDRLLASRWRSVLPATHRQGTRVITNMGAANPLAAAHKTVELARDMGLAGLKVAAVLGDDVLDHVRSGAYRFEESGDLVSSLGDRLVSANAYMGVEGIVQALDLGAEVVITGRVADPALFMAPLMHEFRWPMDGWERLGQATVVGHLLECAGQVCGGYFADPGFKDVPDLAHLGFPIGEVRDDGELILTKLPGTGGEVTVATCTEQLLYEIHDPAQYYQPDVVADFSRVTIERLEADRVRVRGGRGAPRPSSLKVSVGYVDDYIGTGEISYAGPGAVARARLALKVVRERLDLLGLRRSETRFDLIGIDSLHGEALSSNRPDPYEVRIRVAARVESLEAARAIGNEVENLYTNGPAGGGGASSSAKEVLAVQSVLLPRELIRPRVDMLEA